MTLMELIDINNNNIIFFKRFYRFFIYLENVVY